MILLYKTRNLNCSILTNLNLLAVHLSRTLTRPTYELYCILKYTYKILYI